MADRLLAHAHVCALARLSSRAHRARHACLPRNIIRRLLACHIPIAPGLSPHEFCRIQAALALSFPPDLKALLSLGFPLAPGFPDWRSADLRQLRFMLHLPIAGLSYEVARGRFWWQQWGPKPMDTAEALNVARAALRKAPVLVPVYRHYYIPASPNLAGNPVFFVCHKDVSYGGDDLEDFFARHTAFVSHDDYELPSDFASLGAMLGRGSSLGNDANSVRQTGLSFSLDKPSPTGRESDGRFLCRSQTEERKEGEVAEQGDIRKCKEYSRHRGRKLDAMASRNGEILRSVEVFKGQHGFRYCDPSFGSNIVDPVSLAACELPNDRHSDERVLSGAPRMSKMLRRIEFWSDLAESLESMSTVDKDPASTDRDLFSCVKVDVDLDEQASAVKQGDRSKQRSAPCKRWVETYLEGMASTLRKGGWEEADIAEMIPSPMHALIGTPYWRGW